MFSIAKAGKEFKSVPTAPLPGDPLIFTNDDVCRLLPFNSTNTWSGPRPLSCAGSMWSVPSATVVELEVKEGATIFKI